MLLKYASLVSLAVLLVLAGGCQLIDGGNGSGEEGTILWTFTTDRCTGEMPALGPDGTIYTTVSDSATGTPARVVAIGPQGGKLWESADLDHWEASWPVVGSDGTIYVVGYQTVYAFTPGGVLKWTWSPDGNPVPVAPIGEPALGPDGTIYVTHSSGGPFHRWLVALNPNGSVLWGRDLTITMSDSDAIARGLTVGADGTIYVYNDHKVYAFHSDTGARKWYFDLGDYSMTADLGFAVGTEGSVYVPCYNAGGGKLLALSPTGAKRWEYSFPTGPGIPIVGSDDTVYVPAGPILYAIGSTGGLKWQASLTRNIAPRSLALAADGTIYLSAEHLTALNPGGTVRWTLQGIVSEGAPAIGYDGTLYLASGCNYSPAIDARGYVTAVSGSAPVAGSPWPRPRGGNGNPGSPEAIP